jgi:hypothetical protein
VRSRFFTVLAFIVLASCQESAFTAASRIDSPAEWRRFIAQNPLDRNLDDAQVRLEELEFEQAQKVHSILAYKRFLDAHPKSELAPKALALLESLRFNQASDANSIARWRQFLKDHPAGAHATLAEASLSKLENEEALAASDPARLSAWLSQRNEGDRSAEGVPEHVDDLRFKKATSAADWLTYLDDFPAGKHRDEAKGRLLSLEIEWLLAGGAVEEARALAKASPLAASVGSLSERLKRTERLRAFKASPDGRVRRVFVEHYLREFDDVVKGLQSGDSMDRWQAAEELGYFTTTKAITPLLGAIRNGRLPLIRLRAFEALGRIFRSLPKDVVDYEIATRLRSLEANGADVGMLLIRAVLLELSGQVERALVQYQRAWDSANPDPLILHRVAEWRGARGQHYSSAVAARQLFVWGMAAAEALPAIDAAGALKAAREMCSAKAYLTIASTILGESSTRGGEFAEDFAAFQSLSKKAQGLVDARLRDAELELAAVDSAARSCGDEAVQSRMRAAEDARIAGLADLKEARVPSLELLLDAVISTDPSEKVRATAR